MFITVFLVLIVCINYFGIRFFGEFEFWLSSIKVIVIVGLIILSLVLALGGGPDHDRKGESVLTVTASRILLTRSGRLSLLEEPRGLCAVHSQ